MPVFPRLSSRVALTLLCLAALSACQAPGDVATRLALSPPSQAAGTEALTVQVRLSDRHVAALATDVTQLIVSVQTSSGQTYSRTLDLAGGGFSTTFTGLPTGYTVVDVTALSAAHQVLGQMKRPLTLEGGTTQLDLPLALDPIVPPTPTPNPTPTPTAVAVNATVVDGPTLPGAAPAPSIYPYMGQELLHFTANGGAVWGRMAADSQGNVWVTTEFHLDKYAPDGTLVVGVQPPSPGTLVVDAQDNLWLAGVGTLYKLSPKGAQLGAFQLPTQTYTCRMAQDAAGQLWVAEGRKVWRISSAGAILDTLTLPAEVGQIDVDRTTGTAWVALPTAGKVARFDAQGQALATYTVNQTGDKLSGLAIDAHGNAWIGESISFGVVKIAPDGTHLGHYRVSNDVERILIAPDGDVMTLNSDFMFASSVATKLGPDGTLLGYYPAGWCFDGAFDAAGHLWVLEIDTASFGGASIAKIAL